MQIVIEIDEDEYTLLKKYKPWAKSSLTNFIDMILNGAPLPKGHGDLIDVNKICFKSARFDTFRDYFIAIDTIAQAEVIIEADKERKDEHNV